MSRLYNLSLDDEEGGRKATDEEQYFAANWKELYTDMIKTDKHKLNETMKFELETIMGGENAPARKWNSTKKYKFLDTVSKKSKFMGQEQATPIDNALDVSHFLSQQEREEIRELLKERRKKKGGRKRKRKRKRRRGTKKKRKKRNSKKRTRRRRRKRRR
jgi:hypothetical protein